MAKGKPETSGLRAETGSGAEIARNRNEQVEVEEELNMSEGRRRGGQVCFQDWEQRREQRPRERQDQLHPRSQVPWQDLRGEDLRDQEYMVVLGKGKMGGLKGKKERK